MVTTATHGLSGRLPLYVALVIFAAIHLYDIAAPPNGYHQWRESDTAAISLSYEQRDLPLLQPQTLEIASSTPRARVEFPIYCYLAALGGASIGSIHLAAHLLTLLSACLGILLFYLIVARLSGPDVAGWASAAVAFSPLFFFYSFKIMPDTMMLALCLLGVYLFIRYIDTDSLGWALGSALALGLSACIKPLGLSVYLPLLYLVWTRARSRRRALVVWSVVAVAALIPAALWAGSTGWLLDRSDNVLRLRDYLFTTLFFKRLFLQWPPELWVGWALVLPFGLGVWRLAKERRGKVYFVWILAGFLALAAVARYSRQHDYYALVMVPPMAAVTGYGLRWLAGSGRRRRAAVLVAVAVLSPLAAWFRIEHRFGGTSEFYEMRRDTDKLMPPESLVVVQDPTRGAIRLYEMNRRGWYIRTEDDFPQVIDRVKSGAEFLLLEKPLAGYDRPLPSVGAVLAGRVGVLYCYRVTPDTALGSKTVDDMPTGASKTRGEE